MKKIFISKNDGDKYLNEVTLNFNKQNNFLPLLDKHIQVTSTSKHYQIL